MGEPACPQAIETATHLHATESTLGPATGLSRIARGALLTIATPYICDASQTRTAPTSIHAPVCGLLAQRSNTQLRVVRSGHTDGPERDLDPTMRMAKRLGDASGCGVLDHTARPNDRADLCETLSLFRISWLVVFRQRDWLRSRMWEAGKLDGHSNQLPRTRRTGERGQQAGASAAGTSECSVQATALIRATPVTHLQNWRLVGSCWVGWFHPCQYRP